MNPERKPTQESTVVTPETLALAIDYLKTKQDSPEELPHIDNELQEEIRTATATPFHAIDKISRSHQYAEYDKVDNTVYPETFSATIYGSYGDIDANERSISFVIAHDPHDGTYKGFVAQAFHDAESYPIDESIGVDGFMRTAAGKFDEFSKTDGGLSIDTLPLGDDYKRTEDIRPLEQQDLALLLELFDR